MKAQKFDSAFGLLIYEGKFLLLHRDNIPTIAAPNMWCFIGGQAELGETPKETFIRETFEECNVVLHNTTPIVDFEYNNGLRCVFYEKLSVEQFKQVKLGNEGQELRFFTIEEARKVDLAGSTEFFLTTYIYEVERILS